MDGPSDSVRRDPLEEQIRLERLAAAADPATTNRALLGVGLSIVAGALALSRLLSGGSAEVTAAPPPPRGTDRLPPRGFPSSEAPGPLSEEWARRLSGDEGESVRFDRPARACLLTGADDRYDGEVYAASTDSEQDAGLVLANARKAHTGHSPHEFRGDGWAGFVFDDRNYNAAPETSRVGVWVAVGTIVVEAHLPDEGPAKLSTAEQKDLIGHLVSRS